MASDTREPRIRAAVPCPACGAPIGSPCVAGISPHDPRRGIEDRRPPLKRCHVERREAWQQRRREREAEPPRVPKWNA